MARFFFSFFTLFHLSLTFFSTGGALIKVSNWDLKRALDRLKYQEVHFSSGSSDVQLTLDAL